MKRYLLLSTLTFGALLSALVSAADPPATPKPTAEAQALTDKARDLYEEGRRAMNAGRWAEAHAALLAAWRIHQHFQVAANLAQAEAKLGKNKEAAEHLSWYLREAPAAKAQERQRVEALLKEVLGKIAAVTMRVVPEGAEVAVDGTAVGAAPLSMPVFLEPGEHVITARLHGYELVRQVITAKAGATETLELQLKREAQAKATEETPAGSIVPSVAPVIDTSQPATPGAGATGGTGPRKELLIAGGAVAGAALISGVVFTVVANGKAAERDEIAGWERCYEAGPQLPECARVDSLRQGAADFGSAAFWSFVGAGTIGGVTVAYALIASRTRDDARGVRVVPTAGVRGGGVWMRGRW